MTLLDKYKIGIEILRKILHVVVWLL